MNDDPFRKLDELADMTSYPEIRERIEDIKRQWGADLESLDQYKQLVVRLRGRANDLIIHSKNEVEHIQRVHESRLTDA